MNGSLAIWLQLLFFFFHHAKEMQLENEQDLNPIETLETNGIALRFGLFPRRALSWRNHEGKLLTTKVTPAPLVYLPLVSQN